MHSNGQPKGGDALRRLDVRYVHTLARDGQFTERASAFCARRGHAVPIDECSQCTALKEIHLDPIGRHSFVECTSPAPSWENEGGASAPGPAARAPVWTIMSRTALVLCADVPAWTVEQLFVDGAHTAAPIVDAHGHVLGIVTHHELAAARRERRAGEEPTAGAIMRPLPLRLRETAPIAQAAALMAVAGTEAMPVVGHHDRVIGVVHALDVLRWVGRSSGYEDPQAPELDENVDEHP